MSPSQFTNHSARRAAGFSEARVRSQDEGMERLTFTLPERLRTSLGGVFLGSE